MSELFLWHNTTDGNELVQLLDDLAQTIPFSWALLEWWHLESTVTTPAEALRVLTAEEAAGNLSGTFFGDDAELRWRQVPVDYALQGNTGLNGPCFWLAITAGNTLTLSEDWHADEQAAALWDGRSPDEETLLLWGSQSHENNLWSELRIPRLLDYPVQAQITPDQIHAVMLSVLNYRDNQGKLIAARRTRLSAQAT